jgi:dihydrofolate reductase
VETQYFTATSLDGFIATEDDSLDWLFPLGDINGTSYPDFIAEVGALAMGSATYEWMLRHAETVAAETGSPWPYTQPTWVFSTRSLPAVPGAKLSFVQGDVRPVHSAMRAAAGDKNIWVVGGGDLAGQFYDAGLLSEVIVQVGSVTLGKGKPLFPRRLTSPPLALVSVRQVGTGFAELRYQVPANPSSNALALMGRKD